MLVNQGEIYLIRNKVNGLCYVGQVVKYTGKENRKRGRYVRWKNHVREAYKEGNSSPYLYNAIRKYGDSAFSVILLFETNTSELNRCETFFINILNTLYPNGYNMNEGGDSKVDTEETRKKKSESHKDYKPSVNAVNNTRIGQLCLRRNNLNKCLPEFVYARRKGSKILYYYVKFYTDKAFSKRIYKQFSVLEDAILFVDECKTQYPNVIEEIERIKNRFSNDAKTNPKNTPDLPDNIFPMFEGNKVVGYYVEGLVDYDGDPIPPKQFTGHQNKWNLVHANNYIQIISKLYNSFAKDIVDVEDIDISVRRTKNGIKEEYLPKYILRVFCRKTNEHIGYCIDSFPLNQNGIIKRYNKHFTSKKISLVDKYKLAIDHLNDLKKTCESNTNSGS